MRHIKRPQGYKTKQATVLHYLTFDGSLNRFEAERINDHCLHSTISVLTNNYGIHFDRHFEEVPNNLGTLTRVKRYKVAPEGLEKAIKLLKLWRTESKPSSKG